MPGVPGVGKKTAAALLGHFGSLDVIYANLDRVCDVPVRGAAKLGARLEEHREAAMLARRLTGIACDAPLEFRSGEARLRGPDMAALHAVCDEAGFGTALRRQCERISAMGGAG
ncbi:MAG: 5'-3' exonuclease H3TH domain-containing protein [Gammaproteobacteria bacterium]